MKRLIGLLICGLPTLFAQAQKNTVTVSGTLKDAGKKEVLPFVNVTLHKAADSSFVTGTISSETGGFSIAAIGSGQYLLKCSYMGYLPKWQPLLVGQLSTFLDLGTMS